MSVANSYSIASVRTRNTLHEVGARKSLICYDVVERRKRKRKRKWVKVKKIKYDKY